MEGDSIMVLTEKVLIVTGGASGIGRAVVLELLKQDAKVCALDINKKGLEETMSLVSKEKREHLSIHKLDVTNEEEIIAVKEDVLKRWHHIDGLINVAGIIQPFISVEKLEYAKIKQVMDINFYGPLMLIKTFLSNLKERPEAYILNVASMGAFIPVPGQTIYGASKAALSLFSQGLYAELKRTHVHVTTVYPGGVNTNITKNSQVDIKDLEAKAKNRKLLTPEEAALIIVKAIKKNKYIVFAGGDSKFMNFLYRLSPKLATHLIEKQMHDLLT